jgi:hypothetical protein
VIAHGLVEIHGVQDRRVEAGQQFLGDDENLGELAEALEVLANVLLVLLVDV